MTLTSLWLLSQVVIVCEISGSTTHTISINLLVALLILWGQLELEVIRPLPMQRFWF